LVTSLWERNSASVKPAAEIAVYPYQRKQKQIMNKKYLFIAMTVIVAAGLAWALGRTRADLTPNLKQVTPHADQLAGNKRK